MAGDGEVGPFFDRPKRTKQPAEHRCRPWALFGPKILEEPPVMPLGDGVADVEHAADREDLGHGDVGGVERHGGAISVEAAGDRTQAKHQLLVADAIAVRS